MASRAHQDRVAHRGANQADADLFRACPGVHQGQVVAEQFQHPDRHGGVRAGDARAIDGAVRVVGRELGHATTPCA
jgi:hypothetical protein